MKTEFFARTCKAYYGELTFLEAFQRTGRVVNIVCTRSKEYSTQPIVLNYINTPQVFIWYVMTVHTACTHTYTHTRTYMHTRAHPRTQAHARARAHTQSNKYMYKTEGTR